MMTVAYIVGLVFVGLAFSILVTDYVMLPFIRAFWKRMR